jgi:hypothetical protein
MKYFIASLILISAGTAAAQVPAKCTMAPADQAAAAKQLADRRPIGLTDFQKDPDCFHWPNFYNAAITLFNDGEEEAALKWYYAGQIRARVAAGLDPDASANYAMMVAMNQGIGQPLKTYARKNPQIWLKQIDEALVWDEKHPLAANSLSVFGRYNVYIDPAKFEKLYGEVRSGLVDMREQVAKADPASLNDVDAKIDLKK